MSDQSQDQTESTIMTGKSFELHFLCEVMEYIRGKKGHFDIFQPFVDDNGMDFAIRTPKGRYKEIQVKGRSNRRTFTINDDFEARQNYWFIFYCKNANNGYDQYIMSSQAVKDSKHTKNNKIKIHFSVNEKPNTFDKIFK